MIRTKEENCAEAQLNQQSVSESHHDWNYWLAFKRSLLSWELEEISVQTNRTLLITCGLVKEWGFVYCLHNWIAWLQNNSVAGCDPVLRLAMPLLWPLYMIWASGTELSTLQIIHGLTALSNSTIFPLDGSLEEGQNKFKCTTWGQLIGLFYPIRYSAAINAIEPYRIVLWCTEIAQPALHWVTDGL